MGDKNCNPLDSLCIFLIFKSIIKIAIAILRLLEKEKAVTEGGGAAGVAAIIANALPELRGKK